MKKVFSLVLAMMMFMAVLPAASAAEVVESGWCGADLTWTLDSDGTLTVSGTGEMKDYEYIDDIVPWETFGEKIKTIVFEEGVTSIGRMAFAGCGSLTKINIAKSVKRIGVSAFEGCTALKEIHIPEGVTRLGAEAFYGCKELKEISIPESAENIEKDAFFNTAYYNDENNWESGVLYIGNALVEAKKDEIKGEYAIKEGTTVISNGAFSECGNLSGIEIPESVKRIGKEAFYNCENLWQVNILGEGVKIGDYAFGKCKELSNITLKGGAAEVGEDAFSDTKYYRNDGNRENGALYLGTALIAVEKGRMSGKYTVKDGTTVIADGTFYNCKDLTSITIPKSVTYIGEGAFGSCPGLTEINVESGCENYESREGVLFGKGLTSLIRCPEGKAGSFAVPRGTVRIELGAFSDCINLKGVTMPEGVKEIGDYAFDGCNSLKSVTIPDSVEIMGCKAFNDCESLENIVIPKRVKCIEDGAFFGCKSLKSVTILEGVKIIGYQAFWGCDKLREIVIPGSVIEIGHEAFYGCFNLENAVLQKGVVSIGAGVFLNCLNLKSVSIPKGVEVIPCEAFASCISLTDIVIPEGVEYIAAYAFADCSSLEKIEIPKGTDVGSWAFFCCKNLKSVNLPEGTQRVARSAFEGCKNLTHISIPDSVTEIEAEAFKECEKLKDVSFPNNISFVGDEALLGTAYYDDEKNWDNGVLCIGNALVKARGIKGIYQIGDNVAGISPHAFDGCEDMTGVTIPDSVTRIGEGAFYNTAYYNDKKNWDNSVLYNGDILIEVKLNEVGGHYGVRNGTVMIADSAFPRTSVLRRVSIPKSVKIIGESMFDFYSAPNDVYYAGTEKEWNEIEIGFLDLLRKPMMHYNSCFGEKSVYLNGEKVEFDQEPVISDGRTLVPVRAVVESMGGTAEWDDASKTAALRFEEHEIKLTAGSTMASLDGKIKPLDKAPEIIGERMLIPIRFVAEGFGFTVYWDDEIKSVFIEG